MDALFRESTDRPGVWVRRCYGMEGLAGASSDATGLSHSTVSAQITLANPIASQSFQWTLQETLVRLRHRVPLIAARVSKRPTHDYELSYNVPKDSEDALVWAREVLVFSANGQRELKEAHDRLARELYWGGKAGRYALEFHVRPVGGPTSEDSKSHQSWIISLSGHHADCDARSSWAILDAFFTLLSDAFATAPSSANVPSLESLTWGPETARLAPAPYMTWSIAETGTPAPLPDLASIPPPPSPSPEEIKPIPWLYKPFLKNSSAQAPPDVISSITLTRTETSRLHAACKKHGRTVTQVVSALASVSNAEATLRIAERAGGEVLKEVIRHFEEATCLAGSNILDMRPRLPEAYRKLDGEHGTPLCAIDSIQITIPLDPYRQLIEVSPSPSTITRSPNASLFWSAIVDPIASQWRLVLPQISGPDFYRHNAVGQDAAGVVPDGGTLDLEPFYDTMPIYNSVGELGRLGVFNAFQPSLQGGDESDNKPRPLIVDDVASTPRSPMPAVNSAFFEYDGRFRMKMIVGGKWATQEDMELRMRICKERFDALFLEEP